MPRTARRVSNTGIYHVMLRGINRQAIFYDDKDYLRFIDTVKRFTETDKLELYAYCIMSNHVHILAKETEISLHVTLKRISSSFVYWYNKKYERCGHLFQERYKSEVVENDEYFLTVLRYIRQNPIKAGITDHIEQYRWSSYNEYLADSDTIDRSSVLQLFSEEKEKCQSLYKKFHLKTNNDTCLEYDENHYVSDSEIIKWINEIGVEEISKLRLMEKGRRDEILKVARKTKGASVRQLARLTGISKSVIDRA